MFYVFLNLIYIYYLCSYVILFVAYIMVVLKLILGLQAKLAKEDNLFMLSTTLIFFFFKSVKY